MLPSNFIDFNILTKNWLDGPDDYLLGDIDGSNYVDLADISFLALFWLQEPEF